MREAASESADEDAGISQFKISTIISVTDFNHLDLMPLIIFLHIFTLAMMKLADKNVKITFV